MSASLSIRFVESEGGIAPELWDACFPPPLEGRWWYHALERCGIEDQFTFSYAVIEEGARAVGIAPIFLMDVPINLVVPPSVLSLFTIAGKLFRSLRIQRTLFVGSPCSDEGVVGLLPGVDRRAALLCLQRALERRAKQVGAPFLTWKDFPESYDEDMAWLSTQRGLFPLVSFPGTLADLPGGSKDDYFAALKGSRRHQLKKKLRRSAEAVAVDVSVLQNPDAAIMDEVFGLFWQTYEKATTRFEQLNRRFFDLLAAQPPSHFIVLRERSSGQMIAFMLCFDLGGQIINKFIGIDYRRPKEWLLYFRLWEAAVEWAVSRGAGSIQSGQTGYAPKIEMGHRLLPMTNYCRHSNYIIQRVYAAVARTITWTTLDDDLAVYLKAHPRPAPAP